MMHQEYACYLEVLPLYLLSNKPKLEELRRSSFQPKPSIEEPQIYKFKPLPCYLRYAYLNDNYKLLVIISSALTNLKDKKLLQVLRDQKTTLRWTIADIKGISSLICMHKILVEECYKPMI